MGVVHAVFHFYLRALLPGNHSKQLSSVLTLMIKYYANKIATNQTQFIHQALFNIGFIPSKNANSLLVH